MGVLVWNVYDTFSIDIYKLSTKSKEIRVRSIICLL